MVNVLVVEDEADLRELIVDEVESMGHRTTVARDGLEALQHLEKDEPQIILSDIGMPRMNGYELRNQIRNKFPNLARVPFVFVSAYSEREDVADGLIAGADHYVTKPIDFEALRGHILSLVRGDLKANNGRQF